MEIEIRSAQTQDHININQLIKKAFGQENESHLVNALRHRPDHVEELEMVAVLNGAVVGHIFYSQIKIVGENEETPSLALAPMAVLPDHQQKGIGKQLVEESLRMAKSLGFQSVVVLGHPEYYPKFGFVPASTFSISAPIQVPDQAYMALELQANSLEKVSGRVAYPPEFGI